MKNKILPLSKQADMKNDWLQHRLKHILPELMQKTEIDMWIILGREYNEDPVMESLFPAPAMNASRLTGILFILKDDKEVDCLSLFPSISSAFTPYYQPMWDKANETQWECINRIIKERNPKRIGINTSKNIALADGLTQYLHEELFNSIEDDIKEKIVSAQDLAIGWLEKRSQKELEIYPEINHIIHSIIEEAFSGKIVKPGITTTTDVEWWMMEKVKSLGLRPWFPFDVDLQRQGEPNNRLNKAVIEPGDLLRCDVGLDYLGLKTDTQRMAYVLKPGEDKIPEGIQEAMKTGNRFQDIVCENFREGRSGNEIFTASIEQAKSENIDARLYTHPIGFHGHGAGTIIGMWDQQDILPERGHYKLYADTCYALELNISRKVPEWDQQDVYMFLEQTVAFTQGRVDFLDGRQTEIIVIR
ncbi:MAG: M24 family metallopeptidase [Eubacteriales bacterium]|nr:M24 family metallopeptidase [Eubacteriales bacterium]